MQSNTGRALVALAAVALVVAAFFIIGGDDEAGQGSADPTTPTTAETTETTTAEEPPQDGGPVKEESGPEVPTIELVDGAPIDGVTELEFDTGDQVEFAISSDIDSEIHIHGYEITEEVPAGETVEVSFPADIDGIYEVESHTTEQQIAELRVNP